MSTASIYVFANWQVKPAHLTTVLSLLEGVVQKSREEKGNLFYKIHQSSGDANTLVLFEGYTDDAAVETHRNSQHFQEIVIKSIVPLLENREMTVTHALLEEDSSD